jgi:hypothetical protein
VPIRRSTVPHSIVKLPGDVFGNPPCDDRCPGGVGGSFSQGLIEMTSNFCASGPALSVALC